jgi:hypothetical protein
MPVLHKPTEPACFEAKFVLHSLVVNHGVISSWSADSRRAIAHESGCQIGFLNVAKTMMSAHSPARVICAVAAPDVLGIEHRLRAQLNTYGKLCRALSSCQIAGRANLT